MKLLRKPFQFETKLIFLEQHQTELLKTVHEKPTSYKIFDYSKDDGAFDGFLGRTFSCFKELENTDSNTIYKAFRQLHVIRNDSYKDLPTTLSKDKVLKSEKGFLLIDFPPELVQIAINTEPELADLITEIQSQPELINIPPDLQEIAQALENTKFIFPILDIKPSDVSEGLFVRFQLEKGDNKRVWALVTNQKPQSPQEAIAIFTQAFAELEKNSNRNLKATDGSWEIFVREGGNVPPPRVPGNTLFEKIERGLKRLKDRE